MKALLNVSPDVLADHSTLSLIPRSFIGQTKSITHTTSNLPISDDGDGKQVFNIANSKVGGQKYKSGKKDMKTSYHRVKMCCEWHNLSLKVILTKDHGYTKTMEIQRVIRLIALKMNNYGRKIFTTLGWNEIYINITWKPSDSGNVTYRIGINQSEKETFLHIFLLRCEKHFKNYLKIGFQRMKNQGAYLYLLQTSLEG